MAAGFARAIMGRPWLVVAVAVLVPLAIAVLAALPSLWPSTFTALHPVTVDTDPENMLDDDEPVRVLHDEMKKAFSLYDMVVVGVVNEVHPDGVFNPETLRNVYELTEYARTLRGEAVGASDPNAGVVEVDLIAPSMVDNIEQGGPGVVKFEWLMPEPPTTAEAARAVRDKALRIPFLNGTVVSEDGMALALYLPLTAKDLSHAVYTRLNRKIAEFDGTEDYHITGLPVAEDVFGVEMFVQMAVSAPLAMLVIFILMWVFFRKMALIIPPMIVAMLSVILTMGLLIVTGNTIHIMSSMIPIFIMPIAVLDSVHILSDFFDRYPRTKDRNKTMEDVMQELFQPMLFTSLTSAAGFASLALTPIPPVQVFGVFVALGIMFAWILTITFIPAMISFVSEKRLAGIGHALEPEHGQPARQSLVQRLLHTVSAVTWNYAKPIMAAAALLVVVAAYGISQIQINDNPTKWFKQSHPIRVADKVLNEHFGGTYMAFLALSPAGESPILATPAETEPESAPPAGAPDVPPGLNGGDSAAPALPEGLGGGDPALPAGLGGAAEPAAQPEAEPSVEAAEEIFKDPEVLRYLDRLSDHLLGLGMVGKVNSISDIVKTVHRELRDGTDAQFIIPDSPQAVAQTLMQYQSSHRPQDLWHFVTPDYRHTSMWFQLTSGDNRDMARVVEAAEAYMAENPAPHGLVADWFGLTYINVVWQEKMVSGMLQSFLGSFLVVFLMMVVLFRSALWGLLSMIPLTLTIALIYGVIGLIGKDYDMPVAVLSSLTLGLAVDFAIHFLVRSRHMYAAHGSWEKTHDFVFDEPARAITRNVIVIAVGFLPLLAAPLLPYVTVGVFLAAILLVSGVSTVMLLPALMRILEPLLFPKTRALAFTCKCGTCVVSAVAAVALVAVNIHQFLEVGWTRMTGVSIVAVLALAASCFIQSRRTTCLTEPADSAGTTS